MPPTLPAQLHRLTQAHLLVERLPEGYLFAHALVHEATYSTVLRRERRELHQLVGEILETRLGDNDTGLGDVAHHFYEAGAWAKALTYAQRAGEKAQAMFAPHEALRHYTHALEAARQLGQPLPGAVLRARGQVQEILGHFDAARADHEMALALAQATGDRHMEWQALIDLGFLWAAQDYNQTGHYFQHALTVARALPDPLILGHTLNRVGNWLVNIERPHEGLGHHTAALQIFEQQADAPGQAETHDLLGMAHLMQGKVIAGQTHLRHAIALFESLQDRTGLPSALATLSETGVTYVTRLNVTRPMATGEDEQLAQRALRLAQSLHWRSAEAYAHAILGQLYTEQGHYTTALTHAETCCALAREIEHYQWLSFGLLATGTLHGLWFDWATAYQHYTEALGFARQIGSGFWQTVQRANLAEACLALGRLAEAEALLWVTVTDPLTATVPANLTWSRRWLWYARIQWAMVCGHPDLALQWVEEFITHTPDFQPAEATALPWPMQLKGQVLLALRDWPAAETALRTACAGAQAQGRRAMFWTTHATLAHALQAQGRTPEAQTEIAHARHWAQVVGATIPNAAAQTLFWQGVERQINIATGS